ncbi:MAG: 16S rRNA (guanine(527)-N(7))-methyltransferase RsmG [Acidobacteria bacterium]|nr:16S rRNA (guanine(527)-N(7))-methyltransferase RsmG [Acidobacteriota bacterium]
MPDPAASIDGPVAFAEVLKVPRETIHRLEHFAELLGHWQKTTNLVASSTLASLWSRHFADSAQLLNLAPDARLWLDLGSGAGFPGLVIAILGSGTPGFQMHLVEANAKKCAFLAEVVRATNAPVEIHPVRIEDFAASADTIRPDIVSARALAPLPRLLGLAAPFFGAETWGLFLKGREAEEEISAARAQWDADFRLHPSLTSRDGKIVEVAGLAKLTGGSRS